MHSLHRRGVFIQAMVGLHRRRFVYAGGSVFTLAGGAYTGGFVFTQAGCAYAGGVCLHRRGCVYTSGVCLHRRGCVYTDGCVFTQTGVCLPMRGWVYTDRNREVFTVYTHWSCTGEITCFSLAKLKYSTKTFKREIPLISKGRSLSGVTEDPSQE